MTFLKNPFKLSKSHHICPRTSGGSCDCKKNPLACSPVTTPFTGFSDLNCSSYLALSRASTTQGSVEGVPAVDMLHAPAEDAFQTAVKFLGYGRMGGY